MKRKTIKKEFYAHGKLLLTGEYAVLDGAKAIGLPTKLGQKMLVKPTRGSDLIWISKDKDGNNWFEAHISLFDFSALKTTNEKVARQLGKILKNAVRLNSEFLDKWNGFKVETSLEFPLDWGLGSSSSLISNIGDWADVNPLMLHFKVSNGSGYDVACAFADGPIMYVSSDEEISYKEVDFDPKFKNNLYFVHMGKKQDSEDAVKDYLKNGKSRKSCAKEITRISEELLECTTLNKFEGYITEHEGVVSKSVGRAPVGKELFEDYWGATKSLGAWGGDFVLATSTKSADDTFGYFKSKGLNTCIPYNEMIL